MAVIGEGGRAEETLRAAQALGGDSPGTYQQPGRARPSRLQGGTRALAADKRAPAFRVGLPSRSRLPALRAGIERVGVDAPGPRAPSHTLQTNRPARVAHCEARPGLNALRVALAAVTQVHRARGRASPSGARAGIGNPSRPGRGGPRTRFAPSVPPESCRPGPAPGRGRRPPAHGTCSQST